MTGIFAGTRLFEFAFGMYLGNLLFHNSSSLARLLSDKLKCFAISFCIYTLGFIFSWSYLGSIFSNIFITIGLSGLFYTIYQIISKNRNGIKNSLLWLGKNSFSVFLLHQPFMIYISSVTKGTPKIILLIAVIVISFIAGNIIERIVALIIKFIRINRQFIINFSNSKPYRLLIFALLNLAVLISFGIMLGFHRVDKILKVLLFCLIVGIILFRITKRIVTLI